MRKMKFKIWLLAVVMLLGAGSAWGQIIISQVYEGASNNKWIEIVNVGATSIDLASPTQYKIGIWTVGSDTGNGAISGTPTSSVNLTGTLVAGAKLLLKNTSSSTTVPHNPMPSADFSNTTVCGFNGNDAIAIFTGTSTIVDAFGVGINNKDISYHRNSNILSANSTYTSSEWTSKTLTEVAAATNTLTEYIGTHIYNAPISAPTNQASSISFSSIGQTGMTINWTNGNGSSRAVFVKEETGAITNPVDGTTYTASTNWNSKGTQLGSSGYYCVYNGTGTSVTLSNLVAGTTYYVQVYEYNGSAATSKYYTATATNNPNSQVTSSASSPTISVVGTINAFTNTVISATSAEQFYTIEGANLSGNITVTPPAGFEISKSTGTGFVANPGTLTFTPAEVATVQNIYVRFAPSVAQAYSGNITHTSSGATQVDKALSGTGIKAEPTNHATSFAASANSSSQITVTWTDATGGQVPDGYLVKASTGTPTAPADGTTEVDGALVKNITQGNQTVAFTGLTPSTTYNFSIWPYTNSGTAIDYKIGSEPTANATTSEQPWTEDFETGTKASYTAGDVISTKGSWNMSESLIGTSASDRKNSLQSVRLRYTSALIYGELKMNFDKSDGAGTIKINHAKYGSDIDGSWKLQVSIDGGSSWFDVGTTVNSTSATLSEQSFNINQSGNVRFKIVQLSGNRINIDDITITNYVAPSSSTWTGSSSGNWSLATNWNNGTPGATTNVTIADVSTSPIVSTSLTCAALTLQPNSKLTINADNTLTVTGNLTMESGVAGTASLVNNGTLAVSGTTTMQQYLATDRNYYMSSPFSNATAPVGNTYYEYREPGDNVGFVGLATAYWKSISAEATLAAGKGYIVNPASAAATFSLSGALNNGTLDAISLSRTTGKEKEGFNLVGNPYPSYLNVSSINSNVDLVKSYWYRTRNAGNTSWTFDTYNIPGELGTGNSGKTISDYIPPMQAFWVRVASGKSSASIVFANNMRGHQDDSNNKFRAPSVKPTLRLEVSNGTNTDEAVMYFNANAADSYDAYDSPKMFNNSETVPEIYTTAGNEQLVINGMNNYYPGMQLALGFNTLQSNNFSIRASQIQNFDADTKIMLKDNLLGNEFDLTAGGSYNFTSDVVSSTDRFSVLFKSASGTTDVSDIANAGMFVYSNDGRILLNCNNVISENASVTVFNGLGQLVHKQQLSNLTTTLNRNFENGVYVLKVENGAKTVVLRTLVK